MNHLQYLKYGKHVFTKKGADPIYVVLFVTDICTAKCEHCLWGVTPLEGNDLTFDELSRVADNMAPFLFLLISGGEPFLRVDLPDIIEMFHKKCGVLNTGIPTNGSLTTRVIRGARQVLERCPKMDFAIDVSIDAIGKDHDEIRKTPGLFEKACFTYRELSKLRKEFPRFNANVAITVQEKNHEKLGDIYDYFKKELGVTGITNLVVRGGKTLGQAPAEGKMYEQLEWGGPTGRPRDLASSNFSVDNYVAFGQKLRDARHADSIAAYSGQAFGDVLSAMQNVRQELISKILVEDKPQLPCYAGKLSGVIQNRGEVYPCELLDEPLGNLRDEDYDFRRIWHAARTKEVARRITETRCYCTYECFMTNSIIFTPRAYPKLAKELLDIKIGRFMSRWTRSTTPAARDEAREVAAH